MTDSDLRQFGIDYDSPLLRVQTANNVQVPETDADMPDQISALLEEIDPLENDGNYGTDIFQRVLNMIEDNRVATLSGIWKIMPNFPIGSVKSNPGE